LKLQPILAGLAVASLLVGGVPASAHHSVSAQFDVDQIKMVKGVLKKVEWINPHPYLTFTVTPSGGAAYDLATESMAPAALRRAGLSGRDALKVGESYTLYYSPARNGKQTIGLLMAFTLPDGKTVGALSARQVVQVEELKKANR